ncbi:MAG TPA: DUF2203 domain-containing protein [Candidatus Limnocylindrales bacterium]|nr:DUF2203 domain-containing protein [Candidatus Limnocylindrales bacterium]
MTRFFDLDEANETLRELQPILVALRDQRAELIRLRDRVLATTPGDESAAIGSAGAGAEAAENLRLLRMRMQGVIDQMQAGVVRIDELGVTLRDIESGLIDFPALVTGRQVWLCWRLGEGDVAWWHELSTGFEGRQPLTELT